LKRSGYELDKFNIGRSLDEAYTKLKRRGKILVSG
jgi:hypothetical protein